MKINLNSLKLAHQQSQDFHFEESGDAQLLDVWGGRFTQPVVVDGTLERDSQLFKVQGMVRTVIELCCSRCLRPVTYTVNTSFSAVVVDEYRREEFVTAEEDVVFYFDGIADLTPLVEEVIVSDIPISILCQEGCKGLCAICGSDLNTGTCGCREDNIDPRWEKLKQLT